MKIQRLRSFLFLLAAAGALSAADPEIQFSGVLTSDGRTLIALTDVATKSTEWVQPGDTFKGYSVARYDNEAEAVFLKKGTEEIRLPLALAKTPDLGRSDSATTATNAAAPSASATATANAVRANLRQLAAAAQQYQRTRGVSSVSYADLVGTGKPIQSITSHAGENYSTLSFGPNVTAVSVTTSDGATIALDLPPGTLAGAIVGAQTTTTPSSPAATSASSAPAPVTPTPAPSSPPPAPTSTTAAAATTSPAPAAPAPVDPTTGSTTQTPPATTTTPYGRPPEAALPQTGRQPPSPSYTIQGGDTLQSIAQQSGVTVQQLVELNPTLNGSSLRSGETIRIR